MRWPPCLRSFIVSAVLLALFAAAPAGNATAAAEHLSPDRPEAWAMDYFTSISLLAGLDPVQGRKAGSVDLGLELGWIPALSRKQARVGFDGQKEEDLNKTPVFARPRVTVGLPWDFALTLAYVPPVTLFGVKPNLFAFAVERPLYDRGPWTVGLRAYGQIGEVRGAFTCPGHVARHAPGSPQNPFGCERPSADTAGEDYGGLELGTSYRSEHLRGLTPYVAVAGNFLATTFQVNARTFGFEDRTRLLAETWTFAVSGGLVYPLGEKVHVGLGLFYTPLWVTRPPSTSGHLEGLFNVRTLLTYRWR